VDDGRPELNVPVARCAGEREAGYAHPMAAQRISTVLALEIEAEGTTAPSHGASGVDSRDGRWEFNLGEERIANELKLKLGIRVSPRTVEKYLRNGPVRTPDPKQRGLTFVHNHAKVIVACDFFVVFTATFRTLYIFVIMELGTRRILHHNVTAHPTAEWTLQQFREALPGDHPYRFAIHDRDSIFSKRLDNTVTDLGVRVRRTPMRAPMANSICERFGGTLRRECLDFLVPLNERHLKMTTEEWVLHYNLERPHSSFRSCNSGT
jgi:putative transposase